MTNQAQALADALRKGEMAFRLDAAAIERDVRLSELTDDEVSSLVHAVVTAAALASLTTDDALVEEGEMLSRIAKAINPRRDMDANPVYGDERPMLRRILRALEGER